MNTMLKVFSGLLVISVGLVSIKEFIAKNDKEKVGISANFNFLPSESDIKNNQRLTYLYSVAISLDKYKNDHRHYPITSNKGRDWSIIDVHEDKTDWIDGIVPFYAQNLPYQIIKDPSQDEQYVYQSDGANYKLLVYYPPDCQSVRVLSMKMIKNDRSGKCIGYGFWTRNSEWRTNPPLSNTNF